MDEYSLPPFDGCDENAGFPPPLNQLSCGRTGLRVDAAAYYRICAQGLFDAAWLEMLSGVWKIVGIAPAADITVLIGKVADQAALMGVLQQLYNLGFPLLLVEHLADEEQHLIAMPGQH